MENIIKNGNGTHLDLGNGDCHNFIRIGKDGKDVWIRNAELEIDIKFDSFDDMVKAIDKTKAHDWYYCNINHIPEDVKEHLKELDNDEMEHDI
jgi:hypothetical protein